MEGAVFFDTCLKCVYRDKSDSTGGEETTFGRPSNTGLWTLHMATPATVDWPGRALPLLVCCGNRGQGGLLRATAQSPCSKAWQQHQGSLAARLPLLVSDLPPPTTVPIPQRQAPSCPLSVLSPGPQTLPCAGQEVVTARCMNPAVRVPRY